MEQMPCGFGEEPFVFPLDAELLTLKQGCQNQCKDCTCNENPSCEKHIKKQTKFQPQLQPVAQPKTKMCFKCKTTPSSILYKGESMCKPCSLKNVQYKCRVNLQNKIKISEKDRVVVCLSGGMNSICLANVLAELRKKFQKHLLFKSLEAVHVDISSLSQSQEEYKLRMKKIEEFCVMKELQLKIVGLEELIKQEELKFILNNFHEGANQADIVEIFIQRLIQSHYPEHLIALGTSGQRTASNILKYIVKGQGGSLEELGWKHQQKILPFREHLTKQLQFYFYMNKLDQYLLEPPSLLSQGLKGVNTINDVLEDFIDSLQDNYSHTCPTILRTSEKIKHTQKGGRCSFCQGFTNQESHTLCLRCERLKEFSKEGFDNRLPKGFSF